MEIKKKDIRALTKEELRTFFVENGDKAFRGNQVYEWLWSKSAHSFEAMTNISLETRTMMEENFVINHIKVDSMQRSSDGTVKNAVKLHDGLVVESVLIPTATRTTACVSSQVGCSLDCKFCATARLKRMRNLNPDEIYDQVAKVNTQCLVHYEKNLTNIVFMGMGEPADNGEAVVKVANTLADRRMFGLAQSKVTISTVAPDPSAFLTLGKAPAALAWSVHAVDDTLRRTVVPTTKHTMEELRSGLVQALSSRSNKLRRTMLEVALIEDVNDSDKDPKLLAEFAQSIMSDVAGSKVVVNLIPYNAIDQCDVICTCSRCRNFRGAT